MKKRIGYIVLFLSVVLFVCPLTTWATSVSVSVSVSEGIVTFDAVGSFTAHEKYDYSYDPPRIWYDDLGWLFMYHNTAYLQGIYGNGEAQGQLTFYVATLAQGEHIFKATVIDSIGDEITEIHTLNIDATPELSIITPESKKVEDDFDISGIAHFKYGEGGYIEFWLDGGLYANMHYEGATANWSYKTDVSPSLPSNILSNGLHTIKIVATAANGASTVKTSYYIIGCSDPSYSDDIDEDGLNDCEDQCPGIRGNADDGCL